MNAPKEDTRLSRFSTEPILSPDGKPIVVLPRDLTDLDLDGFAALSEFRILNRFWLAAVIGSSPDWIKQRYNVLKREPNLYVCITANQVSNQRNHLYSKLFFELLSAGASVLRERRDIKVPRRAPVRRLSHESMLGEVSASWRIGANESKTHTLITWADHLKRDKTPDHLRETGNYHVPVTYRFDGQTVKKEYVPDGAPHGIRRPDGKAYFVCKEADCGSESIRSDNDAYSSVKRKVLEQIAIIEQELYRTHWGFPNIFFLYYAPTEDRISSIMELVEELTAHNPALRKNFGFVKHLTYEHKGYDKVQPSGFALIGDYRRVGNEPLNFIK